MKSVRASYTKQLVNAVRKAKTGQHRGIQFTDV
jgi:hypothetical protein